ncbi:Coiled-coil domain-containing protein 25 [Oryzias melastigma]|uniref:Coiled-coil domain-containing protein 25 n=1 Tax=Oryzias melastigma TaxID=30732 RepID=A0A834C0E4_ORYME|nr:Coiled-coil domain-containing protein 25 [Oryzias melastigma]
MVTHQLHSPSLQVSIVLQNRHLFWFSFRTGTCSGSPLEPGLFLVLTVSMFILSPDEDLIKYGWPEDVWFHVDKLSSAHVYLRMPKGRTIDDIPAEVLVDCAQLVKNNSIQGCKMNNINVVYTPWANLKKTGDMDVGQIGFHRQKEVHVVAVEKKINEIVNRLEKTKVERFPDLAAEKESRDREERNEKKAQLQEQKRREKEEQKKKKELEELRSYSALMRGENMKTNEDGYDSDDFM